MHRLFPHITKPLLDLLTVRSVVLVGSGGGRHAELMAGYCNARAIGLTVIEPFRQFDVQAMLRRYGALLRFPAGSGWEVLPSLPPPDVACIDGDHNHFTVHRELNLLRERTERHDMPFPVTLIHDTGWPHGRRDRYRSPGAIPAESRHVYAEGGMIPTSPTLIPGGGLDAFSYHAVHEGGLKNGVLTAVEDFLDHAGTDLLRWSVEGFHGLTIILPKSLVEANGRLRTFLDALPTRDAATAHVTALESRRLESLLAAEEARKEYRMERKKSEELLRREKELLRREDEATRTLDHVRNTRSWRITEPLRQLERLLKAMCHSAWWFDCFKALWMQMGTPCAGFIRWIRHRLLGRLCPAAPSQEQSAADRVRSVRAVCPLSAVSVLVTARNNGPFLRECLASVCAQSILPLEILYCDDGSTDDSVSIASSFPGVRILTRPHTGVVNARNAAVTASRGDLLLHVDGDDILTPDFLAEHLHALRGRNDAVIAYGPTQKFGLEDLFHPPQPWNLRQLWTENFVNSSALIRRSAFEAAGGWKDSCGTLWDWDLWLRIARIGTGAVSNALLLYRRHDDSWVSQVRRQLLDGKIDGVLGRVRRAVARISVCAIVGGRLPTLLPRWIDAIADSVKSYEGTAQKPELIILDNSENGGAGAIIGRALERHPDVFRSVLIIPYPEKFTWRTEMERCHTLSLFLERAYNRLQAIADGEILWYVEDDVVVPQETFGKLLTLLTDGLPPPAAVSGLYRNRHVDAYLGHRVTPDGTPVPIVPIGNEVLEVDLAGTGCLMVLRPVAPFTFKSHWRGVSPAHDWTWCEEARRSGQKILLDASIRCRHYRTAEEWL
ncbi:MAG: glycosyltransferase [Candidatus Peribacteraceae bacterium]|nr:glycosyltransferase [Candidatus Peribacteraceae bacterium]